MRVFSDKWNLSNLILSQFVTQYTIFGNFDVNLALIKIGNGNKVLKN